MSDTNYTSRLECEDWRCSAAIVGLIKYLEYHSEEYDSLPYNIENDVLLYNEEDIDKDRYIAFAADYFSDNMENRILENILRNEEFSEEQIKYINELMNKRTSLKKFFKGIKFDGTNKNQILDILSDNRSALDEELYVQRQYGYFSNKNAFFDDCSKTRCRLAGYYVDEAKKGRSAAFNFNQDTFEGTNIKAFEFIPFAFTDSYISFFINDNSSIEQIVATNNKFSEFIKNDENGRSKAKKLLIRQLHDSADFIDYDVEVITKDVINKDYFETLYIRKDAIDILRSIKNLDVFNYSYKISDDYYINFVDEVSDAILNGKTLNSLIEMCLKKNIGSSYMIGELIKLNINIKGVKNMDGTIKSAYACALEVTKKIDNNKIKTYRTKIASALTANDKMRVFDVLLQLSNYSEVNMGFVYNLYEDYEKNIEVVYAFVNALGTVIENKEKNGSQGE
ncbi:type I CRISPR-associated protein Cas8a1/Csx8 [Falcatimonas sp. MSJ-15]|uniref:type I CRISPR-associated protein Cas8a1/Csx8 n=1 Tax=Falcatimonas sp. MSJ-15 TaxID=2841515 RepID=UPI001C12970E|nr:type I CRISPR-associated protein Cas8a1/Csx8 [Falcatimonas sp. MSJ-15]